jgi:hypothetical protein
MARADFTTAALWLAEMELAAARRLRVARVFLHPQLAEVALAGRVSRLFTEFARRMSTLGLEAGLMTNNPLMAHEVLGGDFERFAAVISPCNSVGYKMVPDRTRCESLYRAQPGRFWASEATAAGCIDPRSAIAHVRELGLAGAVIDFRMLEALGGGARRERPPRLPAGSPPPPAGTSPA